jgi:hypothetical protein
LAWYLQGIGLFTVTLCRDFAKKISVARQFCRELYHEFCRDYNRLYPRAYPLICRDDEHQFCRDIATYFPQILTLTGVG